MHVFSLNLGALAAAANLSLWVYVQQLVAVSQIRPVTNAPVLDSALVQSTTFEAHERAIVQWRICVVCFRHGMSNKLLSFSVEP